MKTRYAVVLFVVLTVVMTWPLALHPSEMRLPLGPDGDLFLWTLGWDAHALVTQPLAIFDANIYHPLRHTLAFSENLIGSAIFAAPVYWLTGDIVLAFNLVSLLSCALCGIGAYVLARRVGVGPWGAVLAGIVFAFSPPRFFRLGQMHIGAVQWVPFGLASLHAYLDEGRRRDLWLAAGFFSLEALSSGHGTVFLLVAMCGLLAWRVAMGDPIAPIRRLRDLGIPGLLLLAPAALVVLPYRAVQAQLGLRRSLENWGIPPVSFLAAPTHVQTAMLSLFPNAHLMDAAGAFLFPGYLPVLLALVLLWARKRGGGERVRHEETPDRSAASGSSPARWVRRGTFGLEIVALASFAAAAVLTVTGPSRVRLGDTVVFSSRTVWRPWLFVAFLFAVRAMLVRRVPFDLAGRMRRVAQRLRNAASAALDWRRTHRQSGAAFYGVLTVFSVWLSIGPPLGLWPLVYWMPGFSFIRVPSRFTMLGVLGLAILVGFGFERLTAALSAPRRRTAAVVFAVLLLAEFAAMPLAVVSRPAEIPLADRWLAAQPKPFVVAEVPLPNPMAAGAFERRQTTYMLHSMAHWQPTVHGYSGFRAPLHDELYRQMWTFPSEAALDNMARLGVTHVVVHTDLYDGGEWPFVQARLESFSRWLTLEHVAGPGRVYSLHRPEGQ